MNRVYTLPAFLLLAAVALGRLAGAAPDKGTKDTAHDPASQPVVAALFTYEQHEDVYCVKFSPDSRTLASAGRDRTVKLWDMKTTKERATLKGHQDKVSCIGFSPDGTTLASASGDGTVKLWGATSGKELAAFKGKGLAREVSSVAFSPNGEMLAWGGCGGETIKLWDLPSPNKVRNPFGVQDVPDPDGKDVQEFASNPFDANFSRGADDANARRWTDLVVKDVPKSIDGDWAGRWKSEGIRAGAWHTGTAQVKSVGARVYILYTDTVDKTRYLIDALRVEEERLVGRYIGLDSGTTGAWIGVSIDNERIDGHWRGGKDNRWDLRRKVAGK
jgi:WD40 repeat protein